MQKGLIGKKIGMTQLFDEQGNVVPLPLLKQARARSSRKRRSKTTATKPCSSVFRMSRLSASTSP